MVKKRDKHCILNINTNVHSLIYKKIIVVKRKKGDWDFRISNLEKTLMELMFNLCGEFR